MVRNRVRNKDTIIINVSGPPAIGKTSLCKRLRAMLARNGVKSYYSSFTGFHNLSYLFSKVLYILFFKLLNKINPLCKNPSKIHPYDCIPIEYTVTLSRPIYLLEILSLYLKTLIMFLKIAVFRPQVVLLDEGFPHVILNHIAFFYIRKSKLYISLNGHIIRLLQIFLRHFNIIIILVNPSRNEAIKYWVKRDFYLPLSLCTAWIEMYYTLIPSIVKMIKRFMDIEVLFFSSAEEAFQYILKIAGAKLGLSQGNSHSGEL
jgi:hypothetical protein